jgi:phosphoglycerate dehydrogenase-like enzyme
VELGPLERVMSEPDVVVCTAPLTPRTRRMIGAAELDLLKTDAVFVNVSRGAIVDPDALIARAKRGDIRVSLDVFDPEPIPADSPIRDLPNVFLSPHIAGVTAACRPRFFSFMVDELERWQAGRETLFDLTATTLANRRGLIDGQGE